MKLSLNEIIKVLVIVCLVSHLAVLTHTTVKMVDTASVNNGKQDLQNDKPPVDLPRSTNPSLSTSTDNLNVSSSTLQRIQRIAKAIGMSGPATTFNISDYIMSTEQQHQRDNNLPINALDLITHYPRIDLVDLINTDPNPTCKRQRVGRTLIESTTNVPDSITHPPGRKIPKIIHVTSKTRCMPPIVHEHLHKWRFSDHNFYVHDDAAVQRLLYETYWPEFPHLNLLRPCMISGAAMADLWRYLVLYEYGGIYTDIDAAPGHKFANGTVIQNDDDAWFVVERIGIPSQYFMAASPKHPFMHLLITVTLRRLMEVRNVGLQYVPYVTGPGALKEAWQHFTYSYPPEEGGEAAAYDAQDDMAAKEQETQNEPEENQEKQEPKGRGDSKSTEYESEEADAQRRRLLETNQFAKTSLNATALGQEIRAELQEAEAKKERKRLRKLGMEEGVYVGMLNRTVTIAGSRRNTKSFVIREGLKKKKNHWKAMGMRHFQNSKDSSLNMTCYERMYSTFSPPNKA